MRALIPRCRRVSVCASSTIAVLPSSDDTAGSVLEHMGHLSRNLQSRAKSRNCLFYSRGGGERARKRLRDRKINSLCLLRLIELICQVRRENFPMNIFLLQCREAVAGVLAGPSQALQRVCWLRLSEGLAEIGL